MCRSTGLGQLRVLFCIFANLAVFTGSAEAGPRNIEALFPGVDLGLANWTVQDLSASGAYQHFYDCARERTAAACSQATPFFFHFINGTSPENSHNLMNRCFRVREDLQRVEKGLPTLDAGSRTAECSPDPDEVDQLHLVLCYEKSAPTPGAYCRMATICFAGSKAHGGCGRDQPGDEEIPVFVAEAVAGPGPGPCPNWNTAANSWTQAMKTLCGFWCDASAQTLDPWSTVPCSGSAQTISCLGGGLQGSCDADYRETSCVCPAFGSGQWNDMSADNRARCCGT